MHRRFMYTLVAFVLSSVIAINTAGGAWATPRNSPLGGPKHPPLNTPYTVYGTIRDPGGNAALGHIANISDGVYSCGLAYNFSPFSSTAASSYGYVGCNAIVVSIQQTIIGQHCTLYIFGCIAWNNVWFPSTCSATYVTGAWCPANGQYFWNGIPHGWLVRGQVTDCVAFPDGNRPCGTLYSAALQF